MLVGVDQSVTVIYLRKGLNLGSTSSAVAEKLPLLVDQSVAVISLRKGLNLR